MNKGELRQAMRARRQALPQEAQQAAAQAAAAGLLAFAPYRRAKTVMAYVACRGELSLAPVLADALRRGKTLLLPRCEAGCAMTARRIDDLSQLRPGAYGIPEPDAACAIVPPERIDLVLVPGAAFDASGGRLGQGGGYYDRFLAETDALRVGVCHGFALMDSVPTEAHDARMDAVATPDGVIWTNENRRA